MMRAHLGLSTAYQYIRELKMARLVVENGDQLMTTDQYREEQAEDVARLKQLSDETK